MDPARLEPFRRLYRRASRMGADSIFNAYIGAPSGSLVPLSISHGVDFGHLNAPMDVEGAEPIHWAYNQRIYDAAKPLKPTILAPHPWLMLDDGVPKVSGAGTLVVAAPPGPENDANLLARIRGLPDVTVLVKPRGNYLPSIAFWTENGIRAVTAGAEGRNFYRNLHALISSAERVVGCNFSSALIFAAALGKHVQMLEGYRHHTYMPRASTVDFQSKLARSVVESIVDAGQAEATVAARSLLGADERVTPASVRSSLEAQISALDCPLYFKRKHNLAIRKLLVETARLTGKVGVLNHLGRGLMEALRGREMYATRLDELALWRTGDVAKHLKQTRVRYAKGLTEGGLAVIPYPKSVFSDPRAEEALQ